jgi:hypothetical protein
VAEEAIKKMNQFEFKGRKIVVKVSTLWDLFFFVTHAAAINSSVCPIEIGLEHTPFVLVFFLIWTCKKTADYGPQQH